MTIDNTKKAFELFGKAVEIDPSYARAHAWEACSMANLSVWEPDTFGKNWIDDCFASVTRTLELDPDDPEGHRNMGVIKLMKGEYESAKYHHQRATELCPSDAFIIARYAGLLIYLGEPKNGLSALSVQNESIFSVLTCCLKIKVWAFFGLNSFLKL